MKEICRRGRLFYWRFQMSLPTPKWKEKAVQLNAAADAEADSLLDKLKASKWTALVIVGAIAVTLLVWGISLLIVG